MYAGVLNKKDISQIINNIIKLATKLSVNFSTNESSIKSSIKGPNRIINTLKNFFLRDLLNVIKTNKNSSLSLLFMMIFPIPM